MEHPHGKRLCSLLCLAALCAVLLLPVPARAAAKPGPIVCYTEDSGGNTESVAIGVPMAADDTYFILLPASFYSGSGKSYIAEVGGSRETLTPGGQVGSFQAYLLSGSDHDGFYIYSAAPVVGQSYTLLGITQDITSTQCTVRVTGSASPTEDELYPLSLDFEGPVENVLELAIVADDEDSLIAIISSDGVYALDEPRQSSGSSSGSSGTSGASTAGRSSSGSTKKNSVWSGVLQKALIGGIIGAGASLISMLFKNKKKKQEDSPVTPPQPVTPPRPVTPPAPAVAPQPPMPPTRPVTPQPPVRTLQLFLNVLDGPMAGTRVSIGDKPLLIGRALEADLQYPADTQGVSRRHCQISWQNGTLSLTDLGSTSGTFVRDKGRLQPNIPVALKDGDVIYLGSKQVALQLRSES